MPTTNCPPCFRIIASDAAYCIGCGQATGFVAEVGATDVAAVDSEPTAAVPLRGTAAYCPRCSSTQVGAAKHGYSLAKGATAGCLFAPILGPFGLMAGLIGKNKMDVTCLSFEKRWTLG